MSSDEDENEIARRFRARFSKDGPTQTIATKANRPQSESSRQNASSQPGPSRETQPGSTRQDSPQPGPSRQAQPGSSRQSSPQPGPSSQNVVVRPNDAVPYNIQRTHRNLVNDKLIIPLDHPTGKDFEVLIYDQDDVKVYARRSQFKKNDTFDTNDKLFKYRFEPKNKDEPPTVLDVMNTITATIIDAINSTKEAYKNHPQKDVQVYVTVTDNRIHNGINTINFDIRTRTRLVVQEILDMIYTFLDSNRDFDLSKNLEIQVTCVGMSTEMRRTQKGFKKHNADQIPDPFEKSRKERERKRRERVSPNYILHYIHTFVYIHG